MNIEQKAVYNWLRNNPGSTTSEAGLALDMNRIRISFIFKELFEKKLIRHEERESGTGIKYFLHWAIEKD